MSGGPGDGRLWVPMAKDNLRISIWHIKTCIGFHVDLKKFGKRPPRTKHWRLECNAGSKQAMLPWEICCVGCATSKPFGWDEDVRFNPLLQASSMQGGYNMAISKNSYSKGQAIPHELLQRGIGSLLSPFHSSKTWDEPVGLPRATRRTWRSKGFGGGPTFLCD